MDPIELSDNNRNLTLDENEDLRFPDVNTDDSLSYDVESCNEDTFSDDDSLGESDQYFQYCTNPNNDPATSFKNKLQQWALKFYISHMAITALLLLLNTVLPFSLPLDSRTLMGNLRQVEVREMGGGEHPHFEVERAVRGIISEFKREGKNIKEIKLIFNIDDFPLYKSTVKSLLLILCSELNGKSVYPVGAFYGQSKPEDANEFLQPFVEELTDLIKNRLKD